jgi:sigma-B regulation protein RsbU (phosphoserine phosphatase)
MPTPQGLPEDLEVATWFQAAEAASADTYDVVVNEDGTVAVLLGDVSGHGIGPALIAHSAQSALRSYLEISGKLSAIVERLNDRFEDSVEAGSFMSLLVARLEPKGSEMRRLRYVNAGHGGAWLVRADAVQELRATGPAIAMAADISYEAVDVDFAPGDFLFLCSDGLMEARNAQRDLLGEQAVMDVLQGCHGQGAEAAIARVRELLERHLAGQRCDDDVMLLALAAR